VQVISSLKRTICAIEISPESSITGTAVDNPQ
jgi:hypothetical protein